MTASGSASIPRSPVQASVAKPKEEITIAADQDERADPEAVRAAALPPAWRAWLVPEMASIDYATLPDRYRPR